MDENKKDETSKKSTTPGQKPRTRRTRKSTASAAAENKKSTRQESESTQAPAEEKTPTNLEESVAYLKAIGLRKVSNKTFINEVDLGAFLEGDFTNINKTRALGFIQILEREYPVKLQELRRSYLEYYQQHKASEKQDLFVHAKAEEEFEWKRYLPWAIAAVLLGAIIWYLASGNDENLNELESEEKVIAQDINSDIVKKAENSLNALSEDNNSKSVSADIPAKRTDIGSKRAVALNPVSSANTTEAEGALANAVSSVKKDTHNITKTTIAAIEDREDDLDLDAMVKQMVKEYNITDTEENNLSITEKNTTDPKQLDTIPAKIVETGKSMQEPASGQSKTEAKVSKSVKKEEKRAKAATQKTRKETPVIKSKLYIKPHKKSWVGVIYLDNYEKKQFLIRKLLKLNPNRPQLIVVGQKGFEIFNNGYSYRFRGKGPVRFIYKNGDIMEINNREFQRLSKGVSW